MRKSPQQCQRKQVVNMEVTHSCVTPVRSASSSSSVTAELCGCRTHTWITHTSMHLPSQPTHTPIFLLLSQMADGMKFHLRYDPDLGGPNSQVTSSFFFFLFFCGGQGEREREAYITHVICFNAKLILPQANNKISMSFKGRGSRSSLCQDIFQR